VKKIVRPKEWAVVFLLLLVGGGKGSDVLDPEIQPASKKLLTPSFVSSLEKSHQAQSNDVSSLEKSPQAQSNDVGSSVRRPRIDCARPLAVMDGCEYDEDDLDCCERCYVNGGDRWCINLCGILRCLGYCLSCGMAADESCGICTGCDFAEDSTRIRSSTTEDCVQGAR
jgi:hypothetical protein